NGVTTHLFPYDPPGDHYAEMIPRNDATGLFAMGTFCESGLAHLSFSLDFINRVGVANIQAYRQPLIEKARKELPAMGFEPLTPEDSTSALLAYAKKDARELMGKTLTEAKVKITLSRHRFRVSPSVFNTMADIDRALDVLSKFKA